jgi:hypothetical protein
VLAGAPAAASPNGTLWKAAYVAPTGVCFAEDVFGGAEDVLGGLVGSDGTVDRFDPETAAATPIAGSVAEWVALVLADYRRGVPGRT